MDEMTFAQLDPEKPMVLKVALEYLKHSGAPVSRSALYRWHEQSDQPLLHQPGGEGSTVFVVPADVYRWIVDPSTSDTPQVAA